METGLDQSVFVKKKKILPQELNLLEVLCFQMCSSGQDPLSASVAAGSIL